MAKKSAAKNSGAETPATGPYVPSAWPGAFGAYKYSKRSVMFNLVPLLLMVIISVGLGILTSGYQDSWAAQIVGYVVGIVLNLALTAIYIAGVRGQKLGLGQSFSRTIFLTFQAIVLEILLLLSLLVSLLLLIVPFFFVLPRLVLAYYYLVDKKLGIMGSYKASWHNSKGHAGKVWGIIGVAILFALIAVTLIGIPVALYLLFMYSAVLAVLYEYINKNAPAPSTKQLPKQG